MQQGEKTRQSVEFIINAAIPEFVTKGYDGAVLNDICRNNGISKGRMFHHFEGKDALYLACCRYIGELFSEHCIAFAPKSDRTIQENLHDYFIHRNVFFMRKKGSLDILWAVLKNEIPKFKSDIAEIYDSCRAVNSEVLDTIFASSAYPLKDMTSQLLHRAFYMAQSYTVMNCALGNAIYSYSEARQKQLYDENVIIMDTVIDILLFGLYPRDGQCPERMPIDRRRSDEIFANLQI